LYKAAIRYALENQENLSLFQQAVEDLIIEDDVVKGVKTQMGLSFTADKVILTSGTFLGASSTHCWTFRGIQCAELNACFVNRMRHSATHRINLFHQMPLTNPANRRRLTSTHANS
jgi:hypothetical protein